MIIGRQRRLHHLPGDAVERRIADGLDISLETIRTRRLRRTAHLLPGLVAGESVRTSSERSDLGNIGTQPILAASLRTSTLMPLVVLATWLDRRPLA
jgi:hypothetical protein